MATVNFSLQTNTSPSKIYIRFKDGRKFDIQTTTNYVIDPSDWSQAKQKPKNLKSESFKNLDTDLQNLKTNLLKHFNSSTDPVNLNWLKNFINPALKTEIPLDLVSYFDFYITERGEELHHRTVMKIAGNRFGNIFIGAFYRSFLVKVIRGVDNIKIGPHNRF